LGADAGPGCRDVTGTQALDEKVILHPGQCNRAGRDPQRFRQDSQAV
jgi:hypothetical protein